MNKSPQASSNATESPPACRPAGEAVNASDVTAISVFLKVNGRLCLAPISPDCAAMFVSMLPAFQHGQPEAAKLVAMPLAVAVHIEAAGRALGECVTKEQAAPETWHP